MHSVQPDVKIQMMRSVSRTSPTHTTSVQPPLTFMAVDEHIHTALTNEADAFPQHLLQLLQRCDRSAVTTLENPHTPTQPQRCPPPPEQRCGGMSGHTPPIDGRDGRSSDQPHRRGDPPPRPHSSVKPFSAHRDRCMATRENAWL
mmetsp:Transcript_38030/g.108603  ORF Transcript_38030/g.108603 Transcript_38030/m.108603 type:complete len:145 (-) Transcript_38030:20-454(-)